MPYLRITCPVQQPTTYEEIAQLLTGSVVELFTPRRGPNSADIQAHTTVHFQPYAADEVFIGGSRVDAAHPDVTMELSDWSMSVRRQRRVAAVLTPLAAQAFGTELDAVNMRFHSYPPTDFAVGGVLLSRRVPRVAQAIKRIVG
jgi:phenylpyruvate tautomerase PptA (4-oxalocrotonate tautomerase family)